MSFDFSKAFEIQDGIIIQDGAGVFSGSVSPVGFDAPVGSAYFRTNGEVWQKHAAGTSSWLLVSTVSASKLTMPNLEVSGLLERTSLRVVPDTRTTAASTVTLVATDKSTQIFTGTTAGQIVKLPVATTMNVGHTFELWNFSTQPVSLRDAGNNELAAIKANAQTFIMLRNNSTSNGIWAITYTLDSGNVFGANITFVTDENETSNNSGSTWVNKLTLITPSDLPFGNYITQFQFIWRSSSANREADFRIRHAGSDIVAWKPSTGRTQDRQLLSGFRKIDNISGVQTVTFDFKYANSSTTIYVSQARMFLWRVQ